MATLKMVRVDYRLIHGQVVAKWIKFHPIDRLVLVDDMLVEDDFMADIYRMAAGDKKVDIVRLDGVQETLDATDDMVMLIFKDVAGAYTAVMGGLKIPELNVGAIQSGPGRKTILQGVALSAEEYDKLLKIRDTGVKVFMQPIPEHDAVDISAAADKVR